MKPLVALSILPLLLAGCGGGPPVPSAQRASNSMEGAVHQGSGYPSGWQFPGTPNSPSATDLAPSPAKMWFNSPVDNTIGFIGIPNTYNHQEWTIPQTGLVTGTTPGQMGYRRQDGKMYFPLTGGDGPIGSVDSVGSFTMIAMPTGVRAAGGLCIRPEDGLVYATGNDGAIYAGTPTSGMTKLRTIPGQPLITSMRCYTNPTNGHLTIAMPDFVGKQIIFYDTFAGTFSAAATSGLAQNVDIDAHGTVWFTQSYGSNGPIGKVNANNTTTDYADSTDTEDANGITHGPPGSNLIFWNGGNGYFSSININTFAIADFKMPKTPVFQSFSGDMTLGGDWNIYGVGVTPGFIEVDLMTVKIRHAPDPAG